MSSLRCDSDYFVILDSSYLHHLDPVELFFPSEHLTEFHSALKVLKNEGAKHASCPKQLFDTLQQALKGDRGHLTEVCRAG